MSCSCACAAAPRGAGGCPRLGTALESVLAAADTGAAAGNGVYAWALASDDEGLHRPRRICIDGEFTKVAS